VASLAVAVGLSIIKVPWHGAEREGHTRGRWVGRQAGSHRGGICSSNQWAQPESSKPSSIALQARTWSQQQGRQLLPLTQHIKM
jgi:hypothetical protein